MNGCSIHEENGIGTEDDDWTSGTGTLYFAPAPILGEVAISMLSGVTLSGACGISAYMTRLPDGTDVPTTFSEWWLVNNIYEPNMSQLSFTYMVFDETIMAYRVVMQIW